MLIYISHKTDRLLPDCPFTVALVSVILFLFTVEVKKYFANPIQIVWSRLIITSGEALFTDDKAEIAPNPRQ